MTPAQLLRQLAFRLDAPTVSDLREVRGALRGLADELDVQNVYTIPRLRQQYAVIQAGRLACPNVTCQHVISFSGDRYFNPLSSRLHCPYCGHAYVLGVLAWKTQKGKFTGLPPDQQLSIPQAAELRTSLHGFCIDNALAKDDPVNRFINHECCCPPLPWRADCRIHGLMQPDPETPVAT